MKEAIAIRYIVLQRFSSELKPFLRAIRKQIASTADAINKNPGNPCLIAVRSQKLSTLSGGIQAGRAQLLKPLPKIGYRASAAEPYSHIQIRYHPVALSKVK